MLNRIRIFPTFLILALFGLNGMGSVVGAEVVPFTPNDRGVTVENEQFVSWKRLATAVEETTYADGTHVLADFGNERLTVNGKDVPRPPIFSKSVSLS